MKESSKIGLAKWLDARLGRLLVWMWALFSRPREAVREPVTILFIKFWGIGSLILSEPALRRLRSVYPNARIDFLTLAANQELFELVPVVDRIVTIPFRSHWGFVSRSLRLAVALRRTRYDLVIDAEFFSSASTLIGRLCGGRHLIGYCQPGREGRSLLDRSVPFSEKGHAADQFLSLVREAEDGFSVAGSPLESRPRLAAGPVARRAVRPPYAVVNINASPLAFERRWPRDRFEELGRALLDETNLGIALIGSSAETEYVRPLARSLGRKERVHDLSGKLSLVQLARLLQQAQVLISNDSGPIHMAAALGVPVVGFYGPETPGRYGPLVDKKLVFYENLWCSPCMSVDNAKTVHCINQRRCMRQIEVQLVIEQVLGFLASLRSERPQRRDSG